MSQKKSQIVLGSSGGDVQLSFVGIIWTAITSNLIVAAVLIVLTGSFLYWRDNPTEEAFQLLKIVLVIFTVIMLFVTRYTYKNEQDKRKQEIRTQILTEILREKIAKSFYQLEWIKSNYAILSQTFKNTILMVSDILEKPTHAKITPETLKTISKALDRITKKIYENLDDIQLTFEDFKAKWFSDTQIALVPQLDAETIKMTKELESMLEQEIS